ncbi:MAG: class I SAM-dependent methyltransferase [Nitrosotalea sp.]
MVKLKIIDDVKLPRITAGNIGPPILHNNIEIRKMLNLAKAGKRDIFFDLGCGYGQNLIIASTEFGVRKAYGIELEKRRVKIAEKRIRRRKLQGKIKIINANLDDLLDGKISTPDISKASIIFYSLSSDAELVEKLANRLNKGCKLLYNFRCLLPEIKPNNMEFPFYVSQKPFDRPTSEFDWLCSVSTKSLRKKYSKQDLWNELYQNYEIEGIKKEVNSYKKRLKKFLSKKS